MELHHTIVELGEVEIKENLSLEKSKASILVEIIQYVPNAVLSKTILKKIMGNITVSSLDAGEELAEKTSPLDNFIRVIYGVAEVSNNDKTHSLRPGEGMIIPAHTRQCFHARQFKMISTIIKSGYED